MRNINCLLKIVTSKEVDQTRLWILVNFVVDTAL